MRSKQDIISRLIIIFMNIMNFLFKKIQSKLLYYNFLFSWYRNNRFKYVRENMNKMSKN